MPKEDITPNKEINTENQNGEQTPNPEKWGENGEDWEKRFKDTQASFTKSQQEKVEMARMLVEVDASNIEKIQDEKVMKKILKDKWDVESLEELKIMFPNYNKKPDGEEETDELELLKQKVRLMEHNTTKTKIKEEIERATNWDYKDIIATIPDFQSKLETEMKFISGELSPRERVEKAVRLVINGNVSPANAYAILQGTSSAIAPKWGEDKDKPADKSLVKEIFWKKRI